METQTAITKKQKCIYLRNNVEIWLDEEKAQNVETMLVGRLSNGKFFKAEGRLLNVADIVGIFYATDLDELKRRKQGQWKCEYSEWHSKDEINCDCGKFLAQAEEDTKWKKQMKEYEKNNTPENRARISAKIQEMKKGLADKMKLKVVPPNK